MIMLVSCHVILMSYLHYATSYEWEIMNTVKDTKGIEEDEEKRTNWFKRFKTKMNILYQCLMNGIGNVYIHNWIVNYHSRHCEEKKTTFLRQVIMEMIFALENIAIVVMSSTNQYLKNLPRSILVIILVLHLFGIVLKVIYYNSCHMWADAFDVVSVDF